MPLISVVIPVYNGARFLRDALASVAAQTCPDCEVICVDDGSTDESVALLKQAEQPLVLLGQPNAGQSAARNAGVQRARGTYIAFLDQDDCWYPEKLARQAAVLNADPDVVLVHCEVDTMDHDGQVVGRAGVSKDLARSLASPLGRLIREPLILPSAMMVRREAFERVGMFDPGLRGFEDYDLIARLKQAGRVVFLKESGVRYRMHQDGFNVAGSMWIIRSRERFLRRMRELYADDPVKRGITDVLLAECYSDWAVNEAREGRRWEAVALLWRALGFDPLKFRTYSRLCRAAVLQPAAFKPRVA